MSRRVDETGDEPPSDWDKELSEVCRSSDQAMITEFYERYDKILSNNWHFISQLRDSLFSEDSDSVKTMITLLMEHHMRFRNWKSWAGKEKSVVPDNIIIEMKSISTVTQILEMLQGVEKTKVAWKRVIGNLLVCLSMPVRYRNGSNVRFDQDHPVWIYTLNCLRRTDAWINGLILCDCFLEMCVKSQDVLRIFSTCGFLPKLPDVVKSVLLHTNSPDVTEMSLICLSKLAHIGSMDLCRGLTLFDNGTFFRLTVEIVTHFEQTGRFNQMHLVGDVLSTVFDRDSCASSTIRSLSSFLQTFSELIWVKTNEEELRVSAINLLIAALKKMESNKAAWMLSLLVRVIDILAEEVDVPVDLLYFDIGSWAGGENSLFVSAYRLLEVLADVVDPQLFLTLAMSRVEALIFDKECNKAKFAAYIILGVVIKTGKFCMIDSNYRDVWLRAVEFGAFGRNPPSADMAGLIFAINESCEHLELISFVNSTTWMFNVLGTYLTYLSSCLQKTPNDGCLREVAMRTSDSLATVISKLGRNQINAWIGTIGPLLTDIGSSELCLADRQMSLYGVLALVDKCDELAMRDCEVICRALMMYMTLVDKEKDYMKCSSNIHDQSTCVKYAKSELYILSIDIFQRLLMAIIPGGKTQVFQAVLDRVLDLHNSIDDPDVRTMILKYISNYSSKFRESVDSNVIESVLRCVQQSLTAKDGFVGDGMCNHLYSLHFLNEWKKQHTSTVSWAYHLQGHRNKEILLPHHLERIEAIKAIQDVCYNTGKLFYPYLNLAIQMLAVAVHDHLCQVRAQAMESLSIFLCYRKKVSGVQSENAFINSFTFDGLGIQLFCLQRASIDHLDNQELESAFKLALEFSKFSTDVDLKIAGIEAIDNFIKFKEIPNWSKYALSVWEIITLPIMEDLGHKMKGTDRLFDLQRISLNVIPRYAASFLSPLEFTACFLHEDMLRFFENLLSPLRARQHENDDKFAKLRIDLAGVIGDCMNFIGAHLNSTDAKRLLDILLFALTPDVVDPFLRSNIFYGVGELFFRCDREFLLKYMAEVSIHFVKLAKYPRPNFSPLEAANILSALSKMTSAKMEYVDLIDVLEVVFKHLPLTEDLVEYQNIFTMLVLVLHNDKQKCLMKPYYQNVINVCSHVKRDPLTCTADVLSAATWMVNFIRVLFPEEDDWLMD